MPRAMPSSTGPPKNPKRRPDSDAPGLPQVYGSPASHSRPVASATTRPAPAASSVISDPTPVRLSVISRAMSVRLRAWQFPEPIGIANLHHSRQWRFKHAPFSKLENGQGPCSGFAQGDRNRKPGRPDCREQPANQTDGQPPLDASPHQADINLEAEHHLAHPGQRGRAVAVEQDPCQKRTQQTAGQRQNHGFKHDGHHHRQTTKTHGAQRGDFPGAGGNRGKHAVEGAKNGAYGHNGCHGNANHANDGDQSFRLGGKIFGRGLNTHVELRIGLQRGLEPIEGVCAGQPDQQRRNTVAAPESRGHRIAVGPQLRIMAIARFKHAHHVPAFGAQLPAVARLQAGIAVARPATHHQFLHARPERAALDQFTARAHRPGRIVHAAQLNAGIITIAAGDIDGDNHLARYQRPAVVIMRHAGRLSNGLDLILAQHRLGLGRRAAAQDQRGIIAAATGQRGLQPGAHGQQRGQHADHAGNAHNNDQRRAQAAANSAQPNTRNQSRLAPGPRCCQPPGQQQHQSQHACQGQLHPNGQRHNQPGHQAHICKQSFHCPDLKASTMFSRMACTAGTSPTARPNSSISTTAVAHVCGPTPPNGSMPPDAAASAGTISATRPRPTSPPSSTSKTLSASTMDSTLKSVKPSVLSTASSEVRSRTACIMVLPASSSSVKNTAPIMAVTIRPILTSCRIKDAWKACSVWVRVSWLELADSSSMRPAISSALSGSPTWATYQCTPSVPNSLFSSKYFQCSMTILL